MNGLPTISDYIPIIGKDETDDLKMISAQLKDTELTHINSTRSGGGVAEILSRMVPLMNELGIRARWDTISGDDAFFRTTKAFHNALQNGTGELTEDMFRTYKDRTKINLMEVRPDTDFVVVHDPQPAGLIDSKYRKKGSTWIWRCHIDVSNPEPKVWKFLSRYVSRYDGSIFSSPGFSRPDLSVKQFFIPPSIDPLSAKNISIPDSVIDRVISRFGLDPDRPIVTQISRFDYAKDPIGTIEAFKLARKHVDCQLVFTGSLATDDPEGEAIYRKTLEKVENDKDIHIILLPPFSDMDINALQRASAVVLQKSLREGFGLTVSEAMWKGRPVIASATGGIPLQIRNGINGFLVHTIEGTAFNIRRLLRSPELADTMGRNAMEYVRHNFLITRHLRDYMLMMLSLDAHRGKETNAGRWKTAGDGARESVRSF